ncbi:uncharacterized protein LDX57_006494 [Aspergillus melleus]|uniref:uncharacterized protein n=1 Tax=Aspergillus melleus TaxID=138277 RepID=UPI001E8D8DF1|nr:uncharacterized protein LDX57_006494 [Aspergillus melleus]KAH8428815.1 hypothetical protein LDX57_006494 [Aspergillus melleus]
MRRKLQSQPTLEESSAKLQKMPPFPSSSARRTPKTTEQSTNTFEWKPTHVYVWYFGRLLFLPESQSTVKQGLDVEKAGFAANTRIRELHGQPASQSNSPPALYRTVTYTVYISLGGY